MTTDRTSCNIEINNSLLKKVAAFPYLCSLIADDSECTKDIRERLAKGLGLQDLAESVTYDRLMKALV